MDYTKHKFLIDISNIEKYTLLYIKIINLHFEKCRKTNPMLFLSIKYKDINQFIYIYNCRFTLLYDYFSYKAHYLHKQMSEKQNNLNYI